jgi:hypothetical protein
MSYWVAVVYGDQKTKSEDFFPTNAASDVMPAIEALINATPEGGRNVCAIVISEEPYFEKILDAGNVVATYGVNIFASPRMRKYARKWHLSPHKKFDWVCDV